MRLVPSVLSIAVLASSAPVALAQVVYREIPGDREFTGVLIARPRSFEEWIADGLAPAAARAEIARARRALATYPLQRYVP
ncbi:MAG: hypothetical protein EXS13_13700 [Planctomycetes bacterium]|nr:hypothetical protein [Planctomycetota bacterium]